MTSLFKFGIICSRSPPKLNLAKKKNETFYTVITNEAYVRLITETNYNNKTADTLIDIRRRMLSLIAKLKER